MATNNAVNFKKPFPSFYAYASADVANVTGDGTVVTLPLNSTLHNVTTSYSTATYTFTADRTGKFLVASQLFLGELVGHSSVDFTIVTTARNYAVTANLTPMASGATTVCGFQNIALVDMTAGDTLYLTAACGGGGKTVDLIGLKYYSYLSCSYIG